MSYKDVSKRFKSARIACGMSHEDVMAATGLSRPTVSSFDNGGGNPGQKAMAAMLAAVGLELHHKKLVKKK